MQPGYVHHRYFHVINIIANTPFKISGPRWIQLILPEDLQELVTITVTDSEQEKITSKRIHKNEKFVFIHCGWPNSYLMIEGAPTNTLVPAREVPAAYRLMGIMRNSVRGGNLSARIQTAAKLLLDRRFGEIRRRLTRENSATEPLPRKPSDVLNLEKRPLPTGPIRTAIFIHSMELEGAPLSMLELARGLTSDRVIEPIIIAGANGPLSVQFEDFASELIVIPTDWNQMLTKEAFRRSRDQLANRISSLGVQLVLANTLRQFHAISAAHVAGVPSLWIVRETEPWRGYFDFLSGEVIREAHAAFEKASQIVFVSKATMDNWRPLTLRKKGVVIVNSLGVRHSSTSGTEPDASDFRHQLGISETELVLLNVGRVCALKGQADLVRAMLLLDEKCLKQIRVVFVGDWDVDYRRNIDGLLRQDDGRLKKHVSWMNVLEDPGAAYAAADIYVCTSRTESYPRAILEAMRSELAIATTPVNGIKEQVVHDESAVFFPAGDTEALATSIGALVKSPEKRSELSKGAARAYRNLPSQNDMLYGYAKAIRELFLPKEF